METSRMGLLRAWATRRNITITQRDRSGTCDGHRALDNRYDITSRMWRVANSRTGAGRTAKRSTFSRATHDVVPPVEAAVHPHAGVDEVAVPRGVPCATATTRRIPLPPILLRLLRTAVVITHGAVMAAVVGGIVIAFNHFTCKSNIKCA